VKVQSHTDRSPLTTTLHDTNDLMPFCRAERRRETSMYELRIKLTLISPSSIDSIELSILQGFGNLAAWNV
jgi:hypothetical protein